ncbi:putative MFS family arabinose efflux permease [Nocardia transvalensis]|uniref:Putative MFS family arabinose efflux permease n=1 Tax=Nocardia transvalensis TaxID=37333 RepID=A0A7W9PN22_9NOCA|nr:hypothetical protein [Nocardia transvalensis]MBB5918643.1 putative MFS family arabinose efflux permease [Nocardia transvalensis]
MLFTASFQATLACGALLGGRIVDAASTATVLVCAGVVALGTAVLVGVIRAPGALLEPGSLK